MPLLVPFAEHSSFAFAPTASTVCADPKPLDPMIRGLSPGFSVTLGRDAAIAPELSAAIFDGGLPKNHGLERWVTLHDAPGVGAPVANGLRHGLAVTSAFLFGPLVQGQPLA